MAQTNGYSLATAKAEPSVVEKRHMNVNQVSLYLGISRHKIYQLVKLQQIPYTPYGRRKTFDRIQIDEWVKERTVPAKI